MFLSRRTKNPGDKRSAFYVNACCDLNILTKHFNKSSILIDVDILESINIRFRQIASSMSCLLISEIDRWVHWKSSCWPNRIRLNEMLIFRISTMDKNSGKPFDQLSKNWNISVNQSNYINLTFKNMNQWINISMLTLWLWYWTWNFWVFLEIERLFLGCNKSRSTPDIYVS